MKPTAVLVNTSRGPIVDEAALVAALRDGTIAGAALDVFDREPLPPDHPLRSAPNALVTPHIGYVTTANYELFYGDAVEDIAAFAAGAPVRVLNGADAPSEVGAAAVALDVAAALLRVDPPALARRRRPGRRARAADLERVGQAGREPLERQLAVAQLRARVLGRGGDARARAGR